jgi:hypothetical protein
LARVLLAPRPSITGPSTVTLGIYITPFPRFLNLVVHPPASGPYVSQEFGFASILLQYI